MRESTAGNDILVGFVIHGGLWAELWGFEEFKFLVLGNEILKVERERAVNGG